MGRGEREFEGVDRGGRGGQGFGLSLTLFSRKRYLLFYCMTPNHTHKQKVPFPPFLWRYEQFTLVRLSAPYKQSVKNL